MFKKENIIDTTEIARKKSQLIALRNENPSNFPTYFDDLLQNGNYHLHDHLIQMKSVSERNTREILNEKMSFSTMAFVVLEAKEAIVHHVEKAISTKHPEQIIFLIGSTGGGKSTTLCFLRGDKMILKDFCYESKSDQDHIIGTSSSASCTLLPNIETTAGMMLIDFPGFNDSNGRLIQLATELALKTLVSKYQVKFLALESITNIEERYSHIAELGRRLSRLLNNPQESCILGLTKYSKDPNYIQIQLKALEAEHTPDLSAKKETEIQDKIDIYTEELNEVLNEEESSENESSSENALEKQMKIIDKYTKKIVACKLELEEIRKAPKHGIRDQKTLEEIAHQKILLEETEKNFLTQTHLELLIRFDALDKKETLDLCLEQLREPTKFPAKVNTKHQLDYSHEKFLEELFTMSYINNNEKINHSLIFNDFETLKKQYQQTSLIHAVLSSEVAALLHLPEMGPTLLHKFDAQLIEACVEKYNNSLLALNIPAIKKFLASNQRQANINFLEKLNILENYLKATNGIPRADEEKWLNCQKDYNLQTQDIHALFALPHWTQALSYLEQKLPESIVALSKSMYTENQDNTVIEKVLIECTNEINYLLNNLQHFLKIKGMISNTNNLTQENQMEIFLSMNSIAKVNNPPPINSIAKEEVNHDDQKWLEIWNNNKELSDKDKIITLLKAYTLGYKPSHSLAFLFKKNHLDYVIAIINNKKLNQQSPQYLLKELEKLQKHYPKEKTLSTIIKVIKNKMSVDLNVNSTANSRQTNAKK